MAAVTTPWYVLRNIYLVLIVMFLAALLIQAYFAGRFILGGQSAEPHEMLGWPMSHALAPLIMLASFFTKGGNRLWITSIVWGVLVGILPNLAVGGSSVLASLHPPVAMLVMGLTVYLVMRAAQIVAEGRAEPPERVASIVPNETAQ